MRESPTLKRLASSISSLIAAVIAAVIVILVVGSAIAPAVAGAAKLSAVDYWVSPRGDDRADGTRKHPFKTLARARDVVRGQTARQRSDINVNLLAGTYRLTETFSLNGRDSGRNGHVVTYRAAAGEHPVISGGIRAQNWKLYDSSLGIYRAPVPKGTSSRQLYVNGRRAIRARGATHPDGFTRTETGFQAPDDSMASWSNPSALEAVTLTQWKMMRCPVASIQGREITMQQPCWNNVNVFPYLWSFQQITHLENAYELLNNPGEWYLDGANGWLYYIPRVAEKLSDADVELPVLEALIDGRGTASRPISDLRFQGLTFAYGTWLDPSGPNGYAADQSGFHLNGPNHAPNMIGHDQNTERTPGNVRFRFAQNITVTGNDFVHLGGVGIDFDTGSQHNSIVGNRLTDISSAAIQLGGVAAVDHHPTIPAQTTRDNEISNNLIKSVGREYQDAAGIFVGFTTRSLVAHNDISNVPWSGIAIGWGWGLLDPGGFPGLPGAVPGQWGNYTTPTTSQGNRVMSNRIRRFLNKLWDGGAIYTLGQQGTSMANGELISGNVASYKRRLAGGNTFYTDGGSRYVTLDGNVAFSNHPGITDFGPCGLTDSLVICWLLLPYGTDRGGCRPYGDITYRNNYWQYAEKFFGVCPYEGHPVNVADENNVVISGAAALSRGILNSAGLEPKYRRTVGVH